MNSLNRSCVAFARGKIVSGDVNRSSAWAISPAEENDLLGDPPDWSGYAKWHLGIDASGDKEVKSTYKYPVGKGGKVYRAALIAIRQRAGQQGDQEIFSAAGRLLNQVDSEDKAMSTSTIDIKFSVPYSSAPEDSVIREFGGIAYSGGIIPNYGWLGDCAIDLAVLKESIVFALVNHDEDQRAGYGVVKRVGDEMHVTDGKLMTTEAGKKISEELSQGAPWQLSIGMVAEIQTFDSKTPISINGKVLEVDTIFRYPRVTEVSFVPAGADPNTSVYGFSVNTPLDPDPDPDSYHTREGNLMELENLRLEKDELAAKVTELTALVAESRKDKLYSLGADLSESEVAAFASLGQSQFTEVFSVLSRLAHKASQPDHLFRGQQIAQQQQEKDKLEPIDALYKRINSGVRR